MNFSSSFRERVAAEALSRSPTQGEIVPAIWCGPFNGSYLAQISARKNASVDGLVVEKAAILEP